MKRRIFAALVLAFVSLLWFLPARGAEPKNVILLIGDGMGPESVGLAVYYNRFMNGMDKRLNMERLMAAGNTGYCLTYQYGTVVTDSASAATALASGVKTRDAIIGKDHDGRSMKNLVDIARQLGKSAGVVSNTRLTHATPAAFYASVIHRDMENVIAAQFVDRGDLTVALAGGARHFIPEGTKVEDHPALKGIAKEARGGKSKRKDNRDLVSEAKNKGYYLVTNEKELLTLDVQKTEKVLGFFSGEEFSSAIDRQPQYQIGLPNLSQMTGKALEILSKNPQGFFLMVEGGQIDHVSHGNDVASVLHEMLEFDQTVGAAMSFAAQNPDTLVVVTADHDTGGLAISYSGYNPPPPLKLPSGETWKTKYNFAEKDIFEKMSKQKKSFLKMVEDSKWNPVALRKEIEENTAFPITEEQAAGLIAKDSRTGFPTMRDNRAFYKSDEKTPTALMGRLFGKEMNISWATGNHTHTPVMIFANGPMAEKFRGLIDNVDVPQIIAKGWGATLPEPR
ncbi:MAG: alkaline phosphatase [Deltaproteobacteria bacterium]|nr:alkaline phosphatase [Deltaproteobacteria bacterium]